MKAPRGLALRRSDVRVWVSSSSAQPKWESAKSGTHLEDQQREGINVRAFRRPRRDEIGGFGVQNNKQFRCEVRDRSNTERRKACASNDLGEAEIANTRNSARIDEHILLARSTRQSKRRMDSAHHFQIAMDDVLTMQIMQPRCDAVNL